MKLETLILILTKLASIENPAVEDGTEKNAAYVAGLKQMAALYIEVGNEGRVVSPEVDPILLAAIGYEESRHKPASRDGDCSYLPSGTVCNAIGPMQVSRSTPGVLKNLDADEWRGTTIKDLREPRRNVEAAYRLLRYWSDECKGAPVDALLGNWSAGKCLRGPIPMGIHRCHLAKAIGDAAGVEVKGCTRALSKRTESTVRKLGKRLASPAAPKPEEKVEKKP